MPKEACRLMLTVSLFGIICMAKGLSSRKESAINKNVYYNNDLNYKEDFFRDNELDYENEYFREKKNAKQDENKFESNLKKNDEKSGNIIPINNNDQLQLEATEKSEYNIKIIRKRKSNQSHFRPGKKNPLSYLHINQDTKQKQPEMYIINAQNFNEDVIRRLTRTEKKYELPVCDINENQKISHASSIISRLSLQKRGLNNNNNQIPLSKSDFNSELKRIIRSQWKFRDHYINFDSNYNKYKSTKEFNHINNNNDNLKNVMIKSGTLYEESQMPSIVACKNQHTPSKKENKNAKKLIGSESMNDNNKNDSNGPKLTSETTSMDNNISSLVNNTPKLIKMGQSLELREQTQIDLANQSMTNVNQEKTEDISSAVKAKTEYLENEGLQSNFTNNDFEHSEKNKIQMPNIISPSIPPLTLPNGVVPNISYVYFQPLPFSNSMLMNQPKPVESSSASSKKNDPISNTENKGNDLITISIDPKTLQNKVLHAEFMKKSDVKKTPDTLSIELSPKDTTPTNSSKQQKTVQKPLKISASVKNSSIFITGGDTKGYYTNITNEKNIQQYQSLKENFDKPDIEKESVNRQMKSISSPINMNDISDDSKSFHEYNVHNEMNSNGKGKTDETKVLIINAKQKEVCATEAPCKQLSTYCSIDLCDNDSHCKRSTWNLQNFKEVHEVGSKEEKSSFSLTTKENPVEEKTKIVSVSNEHMIMPTPNPVHFGAKIKREIDQMKISKLINILKPVLVLSPKTDNEGSEDESADSIGLIDKVNLKGSSEMTFEKGNKKVENKILEGFINSIIANYSKDEIKPLTKETTERTEDGAEALLKLLENSMPKRNERDKEYSDEKKTEIWSLTPVVLNDSKNSDGSEYGKLGLTDENVFKSFAKKD